MTPPRSGPPSVPIDMTPPMMPTYRPRSRGLMMSVITTIDSAITPPAARPWTARAAMRCQVSWESPATADDATNATSATWIRALRSTRSASLPHSGVLTVIASSEDVTTQVYADWLPPRSATITGSAVPTTVVDRMVVSRPSRRPDRASSTWRWLMARAGDALASGGGVLPASPCVLRCETVVMRCWCS